MHTEQNGGVCIKIKKLYEATITIFLVILLINIISASCYAAGYDLEFVGEPTYEIEHANNNYGSQEPVYTPVSFSGNRNNNRQARF